MFCLADTKVIFYTHKNNHRIVFLPMNFEDCLLYSASQHF